MDSQVVDALQAPEGPVHEGGDGVALELEHLQVLQPFEGQALDVADLVARQLPASQGNALSYKEQRGLENSKAQELCESRGGRPGLPSLISLWFLWT